MRYRKMTPIAALQLAAPHTWPASVLTVFSGLCLAVSRTGEIRPLLFLCTLGAGVLLQCAVNTLNDYADFMGGTDTRENCGDPEDASLIYHQLHPRDVLALGALFLLLAAALGGYIAVVTGPRVLLFGLFGFLAVGLYTLPPRPFSSLPLGEILSGLSMGGLLPWAAFYIQTGRAEPLAALLFLPCVFSVALVMLVNNISDIERDTDSGRKTLAALLGRRRATLLLRALLGLSALLLTGLGLLFFPSGAILLPVCLLGLVLGSRRLLTRPPLPEERGRGMEAALAFQRWVCGGYAVTMLLDAAVGRGL